jgi:hypothetical protein
MLNRDGEKLRVLVFNAVSTVESRVKGCESSTGGFI